MAATSIFRLPILIGLLLMGVFSMMAYLTSYSYSLAHEYNQAVIHLNHTLDEDRVFFDHNCRDPKLLLSMGVKRVTDCEEADHKLRTDIEQHAMMAVAQKMGLCFGFNCARSFGEVSIFKVVVGIIAAGFVALALTGFSFTYCMYRLSRPTNFLPSFAGKKVD